MIIDTTETRVNQQINDKFNSNFSPQRCFSCDEPHRIPLRLGDDISDLRNSSYVDCTLDLCCKNCGDYITTVVYG